MGRYRRSMVVVNRIKHVVDKSQQLAATVQLDQVLINTKDAPVLANTVEVETGSRVNGLYLKVEVASNEAFDSGAIPNVYMMISKNPGGNITLPSPAAVGASDNKRFVFHQEMIMLNNTIGGNPRVLFNGVIAIPKGYRRNAPNDQITISFISPALNIVICLQAHYKEFR